MEREDYFFDTENEGTREKLFVLVIYDIADNRKRVKLAKYLQGFGQRVQKSAFEMHLTRKVYDKMIKGISGYCGKEDSIRVYRITGKGMVSAWGYEVVQEDNDLILL